MTITSSPAPGSLDGHDVNPRDECTRCRHAQHPTGQCPNRACGCRLNRPADTGPQNDEVTDVNASPCTAAKDAHDGPGHGPRRTCVPTSSLPPLHECTGQRDCHTLLDFPGLCPECSGIASDWEADQWAS